VTSQLRGVGSDVAELLALVAVATRPMPLWDVQDLLGWAVKRVEAAARELVSRGIMVQTQGIIRLAHDLIRAAVEDDLPESTQRRLHARFAHWIERQAGSELQQLRQALKHRRAAGMDSLHLALRLARAPRRTLLGVEGLRLLAWIADDVEARSADVGALNEDIATVASHLGDHELALERWLLAADAPLGELRRSTALLGASRAGFDLGRSDIARAYLDRARLHSVGDPVFQLELDVHESAIRLWLEPTTAGGRDFARRTAASARELAQSRGGVEGLDHAARHAYLGAHRVEYDAAMQEGRAEDVLQAADRAAEVSQGFDQEQYLSNLLDGATALGMLGREREEADRLRRALHAAGQHVLPRLELDASVRLASSLQVLGELDRAEAVLAGAEQLSVRVGDDSRFEKIPGVKCEIAVSRGPWREAVDALEASAQREQEAHYRLAQYEIVALSLARVVGESARDEVVEYLRKAQADAATAGCPRAALRSSNSARWRRSPGLG
jgi:hypothetical protein